MATDNTHTSSTKKNYKVEQLKMNLPVRLFIFGGAVHARDNSAFNFASKNVQADYNNDLPVMRYFINDGANTIVNALKVQNENSVQSLDLFCHGDPVGIYFVVGSFLDKDVINTNRSPIGSNIYKDRYTLYTESMFDPAKLLKNQYSIANLNLKAFTNESKIEIHGCNTGRGVDCFASELSKQMFKAGKVKSVVIGHASKTNPNIDGTTSVTKQDYRHGLRVIYHNGQAMKTINTSGRIPANIIRDALGG